MDTNKHESGTDRKSLVSIGVHSWCYSTVHNSACKVIEEQTLWGQTVCRVWLPNPDSVVRIPASGLIPLASRPSSLTTDHIAYVAAAAKVNREEERGMIAFASRRKAIDRLGLPEVRQFRLARLDEDESQWRSELKSARQIVPEMRTLLAMQVRSAECEVRL
jgi:hypothetical protein